MRISDQTREPQSEQPVFQKEPVKNFRQLTFKEKLNYIWDYYKWWFVFGILFLTIAVLTIPTVIENHKEPVLYAAFINTQIRDQASTTIMDDFVEKEQFDMKGKRIVLDTSLIINRERADQFSMQCNQKVLALFSSNTLDVMLSDDENYQFYASQGAFQSLEEVLPADVFEKYKPYMLTCNSKDFDQTVYYGINVRTSKVLHDENAYIVEPIFSICTNASQPENAVKFLEYLMEEEIILPDETDAVSADAVTVSPESVSEDVSPDK